MSSKMSVSHSRCKTWSKFETDLLFECIKKYKPVITAKEVNSRMNELKNKAWEQVCHKFNASTIGEAKTVIQLKNKYKNEKRSEKAMKTENPALHVLEVIPPADQDQSDDLHFGKIISEVEIANEDASSTGGRIVEFLHTPNGDDTAMFNGGAEDTILPTEDEEPSSIELSIRDVRTLKRQSKFLRNSSSSRLKRVGSSRSKAAFAAEEMALAARTRKVAVQAEVELSMKLRQEEHDLKIKVLKAKLEAQEAKRDYYLNLAMKKRRTSDTQSS